MSTFLEISRTGVTAIWLHSLRSLVTLAALLAVLIPYVSGLAISKGIEQEAQAAVQEGADLYVTATQFGRPVPLPLETLPELQRIDGVLAVTPRITGHLTLGKDQEPAVVVGLPPGALGTGLPDAARVARSLEGRLPELGPLNELVVGSALARRLRLEIGSRLPPFYHNEEGERLSEVVGVFRPDAPLWSAHLVLTTFDTAQALFNQRGLATELLVSCRPGYQESVGRAILQTVPQPLRTGANLRLQVTSRTDLAALLPAGLLHREGIFNLHFVLAFAVGIPIVLVTSGLGLRERRREIGILKATGWQTDEILLRSLVENFLLCLGSASLAVVIAFVWLRLFNGYGIASVFLTGAEAAPAFRVPCRLTPVPALLAFVLSFVVVMSGTLATTWRAATVPPVEAMR
jgi:ABC-type lipoprotein release transport system permease subunit